nr:hypothetical protein Iba_chr01dCG4600 [Ipomoea batatas]
MEIASFLLKGGLYVKQRQPGSFASLNGMAEMALMPLQLPPALQAFEDSDPTCRIYMLSLMHFPFLPEARRPTRLEVPASFWSFTLNCFLESSSARSFPGLEAVRDLLSPDGAVTLDASAEVEPDEILGLEATAAADMNEHISGFGFISTHLLSIQSLEILKFFFGNVLDLFSPEIGNAI